MVIKNRRPSYSVRKVALPAAFSSKIYFFPVFSFPSQSATANVPITRSRNRRVSGRAPMSGLKPSVFKRARKRRPKINRNPFSSSRRVAKADKRALRMADNAVDFNGAKCTTASRRLRNSGEKIRLMASFSPRRRYCVQIRPSRVPSHVRRRWMS